MPPFEAWGRACSALFSFSSPTKRIEVEDACQIGRVPDDVLEELLLGHLDVPTLCRLAQVSHRFQVLASNEMRWQELFCARFGPPSPLASRARKLAGSWRGLYASKSDTDKRSAPWHKPCVYELDAALAAMTAARRAARDGQQLVVVFLVDGSGSVGEEDFSSMTGFLVRATEAVLEAAPDSKVGVVQFSNDCRVEFAPAETDVATFTTSMQEMVRMNGGTNIAAAVQRAGQLLKAHAAPEDLRLVVLLTDGRVDPHQGKEAAAMVARLADEQANVSMYAFGVGRGVDSDELRRVIGRCGDAPVEERYVELCVRDEAPW